MYLLTVITILVLSVLVIIGLYYWFKYIECNFPYTLKGWRFYKFLVSQKGVKCAGLRLVDFSLNDKYELALQLKHNVYVKLLGVKATEWECYINLNLNTGEYTAFRWNMTEEIKEYMENFKMVVEKHKKECK